MAEKTNQHVWLMLMLLAMAQFMVVLDFSIVNVALATIQQELHFTQADLQWVVTAYALTFGGLLLLGGRIGDLYGRRPVFLVGLVLFSVISFIGGLAQTELMLVVARAVQGIASALIMSSSMALITSTFVKHSERQRALSILGGVGSSGFAAGVVLSGLLTATLGWRWVLFVNVPIGIVTALLSLKFVRETVVRSSNVYLDIPGALSITSGLVVFVYVVTSGGNIGYGSPQVLLLAALCVILLASFVVIELRSQHPLVPFRIFRLPSLRGANVSVAVGQGAFATMFLLTAQYLQDVLGYSPLATGLMFLPMGAAMFIMSSYLSSKLMDRFGVKRVVVSGLSLAAVGFLFLIEIPTNGTYLRNVFPGITLVALGMGTSFPGLLIASVSGVPIEEQGLASGLINTSRQIGASIGIAILIAIAETRTRGVVADQVTAFASGIRYAFIGGFALMVLSAVASALLIRQTECAKLVREGDAPQDVADRVWCLQ